MGLGLGEGHSHLGWGAEGTGGAGASRQRGAAPGRRYDVCADVKAASWVARRRRGRCGHAGRGHHGWQASLVRAGWPRAHFEGAASRGYYVGETGQSKQAQGEDSRLGGGKEGRSHTMCRVGKRVQRNRQIQLLQRASFSQ